MNEQTNIHPVVLAGGAGKRLWPVSRHHNSKPFAIELNNETLFEATVRRLGPENGFEPLIILGAHEAKETIHRDLRKAERSAQVFLEPVKRDTAAAVITAAMIATLRDPRAIVACLASDHHIGNEEAFLDALRRAAMAAQLGYVTLIGIVPHAAESRFGYISTGAEIESISGANLLSAFMEKPDAELASEYVSKGYLWNSGNFIFRADVFLSEAQRLAPDIFQAATDTLAKSNLSANPCFLDDTAFATAPSISVDYAIVEKLTRGAVVRGDFGWSDLGTWQSMKDTELADKSGSVVRGDATVCNVTNSLVISEGNRLVAVSNLDNIVVVDQPDALLVCPVDDGSSVKSMVDMLEALDRSEVDRCAKETRPWGTFCTVFKGPGFLVKHITVIPGGKLSLQKHAHRSEHWVVVEGIATVTVNDRCDGRSVGEHAHIPLGAVHRLENRTKTQVSIMEVQIGEILSEDDIVRLEDVYDRPAKSPFSTQ